MAGYLHDECRSRGGADSQGLVRGSAARSHSGAPSITKAAWCTRVRVPGRSQTDLSKRVRQTTCHLYWQVNACFPRWSDGILRGITACRRGQRSPQTRFGRSMSKTGAPANLYYLRNSARCGVKVSIKRPVSRALTPCVRFPGTMKLPPCSSVVLTPSMVTSNRPSAT